MSPLPLFLIRRALLLLLAVVLAVVTLAACGDQPTSSPRVVVLIASATSNEPAPALAPQDVAELSQAAAASNNAVAEVVNTNTGQPARVSLTPRRPDGQVDYGPSRHTVLSRNLARVGQLVGQQSADGPFDLLSLIAKGIKVSSTPGDLIVVTAGLSTAGGFNLTQLGWSASPAAVAAQLKRDKLLPNLTGWHVIFSGLGVTAGKQAALPLPQQSELVDYIMAICRAAAAASCATDDVTRPDRASHSTYPDPMVAVPAPITLQGPHHAWGKQIPADIFFRLNSSVLLPGADDYLAPLATEAASQHAQVTIRGFASPESGTPSYNQHLSLVRALAIRDRLIALGVDPRQIVQVAGEGTGGKTAAACYRDGHFDQSACAALRHVDILVTPTTGLAA